MFHPVLITFLVSDTVEKMKTSLSRALPILRILSGKESWISNPSLFGIQKTRQVIAFVSRALVWRMEWRQSGDGRKTTRAHQM